VSLAVGMALNFFLPGAGTAIGAMVQATGTAAASQFAGRVVANNGNFGQALKDMRSKQAMRSLIAAAATANFGGQSAPINSVEQFVERLPEYLTKGMGTGALSAAIQKQNILRGIGEGATFGVASAVGNFGATNLSCAYNYGEGQIGYAQHKLGHMALGGALGAIISKDRLKGALIGGLSAGGAEIVAEALMGDVTAQVIDLQEAGFTDDQSKDHIMKLARFNGEFSKLAAAGIAATTNQNIGTALFTASNAIENNFYHTDFFRRDITFGTETIGGPLGGSPQRGNRLAQQNKGATQNATPTEASKNPANYNSKAGDLAESSLQAHFLRNNLIAREIGGGHALEKHVVSQGEFPGWIRTRQQLTTHIEQVLNDQTTQVISIGGGKTAYIHRASHSVIIRNPNAGDGGTIFQPATSMDTFLNKRRWE
jgi:hypothetical protein